jgi:NIMA (never in mitosis gene a)-related kinase
MEYIIQKTLGKGSYGIVYKVQKQNTNEIYVLKKIPLKGLSEKEISEVRQEAKILSSINSDFVVKYFDSFEENNNINIVMEYCDKGDLNDFILRKKEENKLIEEAIIWNLFIKITIGLAHIHKMKILHRDLKTMNIFLKDEFQVKIGDLGVAKILLKNSFAKTLIGTPYYLSPEICEEKPYNDKSDVWALGCILYELCTYKHPFDAKSQGALILKIMRNIPEDINQYYSNELRNLIFLLLEKDSQKRPSCIEILKYDFVIDKVKKLGYMSYLEELDKEKENIKYKNNFINNVEIPNKIIKENTTDNYNNNDNKKQNISKNNLEKKNSKKEIGNVNINKNENLIQKKSGKIKVHEIKINEIKLLNKSNNINNQQSNNRTPNNLFMHNNFFINDGKNKYNKKLSNVIISRKNEKITEQKNPEIISKKIGKINPFRIVLNIPNAPQTNKNFFSKKILSNRNYDKKDRINKEKEDLRINNNINIKKVTPKLKISEKKIKIEQEVKTNNKNQEKDINAIINKKSNKIIIKKEKNDIIKYNKLIFNKDNNTKNNKYLINILQSENNKNIDKKNLNIEKNIKEKENENFEIINNQSNDSSEKDNKSLGKKNKELEDSMEENDINNIKNESYKSSHNNSSNKIENDNNISGEYNNEENVQEIIESKNINLRNSVEFEKINKKKELNEEILALERKNKEIKNEISNLIGKDDYEFIMNLFENNNKEQNKNDEACEEIENFCNNKYSPDKKEKFLNYYLSLICNDCLLSKKYNEKNNLDV